MISAEDVLIRPYQAKDRQEVHRIMADTAFFGEPVEIFLDDRQIFCDIFCTYYTDNEPGFSWVVEIQNKVVGTLLGCSNTRIMQRDLLKEIFPAVVRNGLRGNYRFGRKTWNYARAFSSAHLRNEHPVVNLYNYPAHLHMNIERKWRGNGFGRKLLLAYLDQLKRAGVHGVHLRTTNLNQAACRLYQHVGFQLIDAKNTKLWSSLVSKAVENRLYGLIFSPP